MKKKHYDAIAREIKKNHMYIADSEHARTCIRLLAFSLCGTFMADNPKFSRDMFLKACDVPYEPMGK